MIEGRPQVRPSVVLFLRETGAQVEGQLRVVLGLAPLDPPLERGVALLAVRAGGPGTASGLEAVPRPLGAAPPCGLAVQAQALEELIPRLARCLQGRRTRDDLRRNGYVVPAPVQVYVVAHAGDPWLGPAHGVVRKTLRDIGLEARICHLLDCARPREGGPAPRPEPLAAPAPVAAGLPEPEPADLTFLFHDRAEAPMVVFAGEDALRHYVMAQAVFALVATGVTMDAEFRDLVTRPPEAPGDKVGSLKAALVVFPGAAVEAYASAHLGAALVGSWLAGLRRARVSAGDLERERGEARKAVEAVRESLQETVPRPGCDPDASRRRGRRGARPDSPDVHRWAPLDVLRAAEPDGAGEPEQRRLLFQMQEENRRLFELFARREVDAEARLHGGAATWADAAGRRAARAPDRYRTWARAAESAWACLEPLFEERVRDATERRWSSGDEGIVRACAFLDEYCTRLARLSDDAAGLRGAHADRYRAGLDAFRERARPWMIPPRAGAVMGVDLGPGVVPALAPAPSDSEGAGAGGLLAGSTPPDGSEGPEAEDGGPPGEHLDEGEERIAGALRERAGTYRALVPAWSGLLTSAALALASLGLPLLALLGVSAPGAPLEAGIVAGASVAVGCAAHAALRRHRRRAARAAETDLLRLFTHCYAYRCETLEDDLRVMALTPLRSRAYRVLLWLQDVEELLSRTAGALREAAAERERALFDSPPAQWDCLVGAGRRLERPAAEGRAAGTITLAELAAIVGERGTAAGGGWADGQPGLRRELAAADEGGRRLHGVRSAAEARDHVMAFVRRRVVLPALSGDLVDVRVALEDDEVRRCAWQATEVPQCELRWAAGPFKRFGCGSLPPAAGSEARVELDRVEFVRTYSAGWYLFVSLFHGAVA